MSNQNAKKSQFWKIYACVVASALILVFVGLAIFYDFIKAYETSQPLYAAETFAVSLEDETVLSMIDNSAAQLSLDFETAATAAEAYRAAFLSLAGEYSCQREYGSDSGRTVFQISRDGAPFLRLTLRESSDGRYGFSSWTVEQTEVCLEALEVAVHTYQIYAPCGAEVCVNGVPLAEKYMLLAKTAYPFAGVFEAENAAAVLYQVNDLYAEPAITCTLAGESCKAETEQGCYRFLYPGSSYTSYTVTVPTGSSVWLNDVAVSNSYLTDTGIPYTADALEAAAVLPTTDTYTIPDLIAQPAVRAVWNGVELDISGDSTAFVAAYPQTFLYNSELRVPSGSTVTVRGVDCTAYYSAAESAYPELYGDDNNAPQYDVYSFCNLFCPLEEISVTYGDVSLPLELQSESGRESAYLAQYPTVESEEVHSLALDFVHDYFHYVSQGYNNTETNLSSALTHVLYGSDLYNRIQRSLIGIQFVTPVSSQNYKTLEITEMRRMPDGTVYCLVSFDIDQRIYYVNRSYIGTLALTAEQKNGTWKISRMLIDSES